MTRHIIKNNVEDINYWHNAIVHWVAIATMLINVGVFAIFAWYVHPTDVPLRLQYNVFFGTSLHTVWWQVYALPIMGFVFFLLDLIVGYVMYNAKERIASYCVLLGALFANVALLISAISVIFNNYVL